MKKWVIAIAESWDVIPNALHIERNDACVRDPEYDDFAAARTAMKKGVKLIHDIEGIHQDFYLDTPENRKIILDYMEKHPEEVGRELIGIQ